MRIKIPWLLDIETVSEARDIVELAQHPSLDRDLEPKGPLINRIMLRRILSTFHAQGKPLPGFRGKDDAERAIAQTQLQSKLDKLAKKAAFDSELLKPAIAYVAGTAGQDIDKAMAAICHVLAGVFNKESANINGGELWEHAQVVQASVQPLSARGFYYRFTGKNISARDSILASVNDEPNGLHAIAITTPNIVESLLKMNALSANHLPPRAINTDTPDGFWLLVRMAPETLFRKVRATVSLPTSGSILTRDALIMLRPRKAQRAEPTLGYTFMADGWSACPASAYVPAMCWFIWTHAQEQNKKGDRQ